MLVSDGDKKPHLISCEATCVHEEVAKRIPNVRFINRINKHSVKKVINRNRQQNRVLITEEGEKICRTRGY